MSMKPDELFRLLNFCKTIQTEGTDPFDLDVKKVLETLTEYQKNKNWKSLNDLLLDADAIAELTKIIELQSKWIKDRSASFYMEPGLLDLKLKMMESEELAAAFLKSWYPIIAMDRMTQERLKEGLAYWNALLPFSERSERNDEFPRPSTAEIEGTLAIDDLIAMSIFSRTEFNDLLQSVLEELEERGSVGGDDCKNDNNRNRNRLEYHDFVYESETFENSLEKAYLTSYLVNEGKAEIIINPLEEEVFISSLPPDRNASASVNASANANANRAQTETKSRSIAISLSYDDWLRWREKRNRGNGKRNGQNGG